MSNIEANRGGVIRKRAIFTICSNNYLPRASVLLASARRFQPDADLFLCLADEPAPETRLENCTVVLARDLGIPDFDALAFRYGLVEFNTALKPFVFRHLLRDYGAVLYFDPDIEVFASLESLFLRLDAGASILLTPHILSPAPGMLHPSDRSIMAVGVYNLGFLGVRACAEAEAVIGWWAERLTYECVLDLAGNLFVDQRFMDLVPAFAPNAVVLHDTALNVAYWNLAQRTLGETDDGWTVDGRPLVFFHFSGFDLANPEILSNFTEQFRGAEIPPPVAALIARYVANVRRGEGGTATAYAYATFRSGASIPYIARKSFRDLHPQWEGNPFDNYEAWLQQPSTGVAGGGGFITNLMKFVWDGSREARALFDPADPVDCRAFALWCRENRQALELEDRFLGPVAGAGVPTPAAPGLPGAGREAIEAFWRELPAAGFGEPQRFGPRVAAGIVLTDGWSHQEAWGRWSVGDSASCVIKLQPTRTQELRLIWDAEAFVGPRHPEQRVMVFAGGTEVASAVLTAANPRLPEMRVPWDPAGQLLRISLVHPGTVSPASIAASTDPRRLGIAVRSIIVVPDGPTRP